MVVGVVVGYMAGVRVGHGRGVDAILEGLEPVMRSRGLEDIRYAQVLRDVRHYFDRKAAE